MTKSAIRKEPLITLAPRIAEEWHPTKNGALSPEVYVPGSRKVWWLCSQDERHEWEATLSNRVKMGSGCPYCSGNRVLAGFNDLATTHPALAEELCDELNGPGITAATVSAGSNKKLWWRCVEGHAWQAQPNNRRYNKYGCPQCAGLTVNPGVNDLATVRPDLAVQWHPTKNDDRLPRDFSVGSKYEAWWLHQDCLHEWQASIKSQSARPVTACPICLGTMLAPGVNDLATTNPDAAEQWHPTKNEGLLVTAVSRGSSKKVWWQCDLGHSWKEAVKAFVRKKTNVRCPYCNMRKLLRGFNDFATRYPDLAAQFHPDKNPVQPGDLLASKTEMSVVWLCQRGHEWKTSISHRLRGTQCVSCRKFEVIPGSLMDLLPDLASQWHPTKNGDLTPYMVSPGSDRLVWWQCFLVKEHEWEASVKNRTLKNSGCPRCYARTFVSRQELELQEILRAWGLNPIASDRKTLKGKELDIYLPERQFAIEFNGCYWHSEAVGKSKSHHADKVQACKREGVTLYQVWEDDWRERKSIVVRGIAHRLGLTSRIHEVLPDAPAYYAETVGARQCRVVQITPQQSQAFLDLHHLQGHAAGTRHLGLQDNQERLRAVMVIKRVGGNADEEYRIERYATAGVVMGGFTKLMKHAEQSIPGLRRWITFSDNATSDGALYKNSGFNEEAQLRVDYSYLVGGKRVHKFNYRLARFRKDPNLRYEEGLSERELAQLNGLYRIWDSGKIRWVKEVS